MTTLQNLSINLAPPLGVAAAPCIWVAPCRVPPARAAPPTLPKVWQQDTALSLDLEGGGNVVITMAEASSSVVLRDKAGEMEYAD